MLAAGLPLRALAGAALAAVPASFFLMGCAYLLALFLVVGKRQWELQNAGRISSAEHRPVLAAYRGEGLDFLFVVTALATVASYAVYSVIPSTLERHGGGGIAATIPLLGFGGGGG